MMIDSLLDTDLYKLTMMQGVLHQFPGARVRYAFRCRTPDVDLRPLADRIRAEIRHLCRLRFSDRELEYLGRLRFIKDDFVEFLRIFQLNESFVTVEDSGEQLAIYIEGPWLHTILFEVPLLAIISECWAHHLAPEPDLGAGERRLRRKIQQIREAESRGLAFRFSDFGTRRRMSQSWQKHVVTVLQEHVPESFSGTSNVALAMERGLSPIGTMAHEWLMAAQALGPRLVDSQRFALEHWVREYRGDLGIALSDVVGYAAFLRDFDLYFSKLFDGCRHDSGDPVQWGERLIEHYEKMGIDPRTKTAIFSDGLQMENALALATHFEDRIQTAFGIGTSLTNDLALPPVQIVIKLVACQGAPVAKISDSPGKQMCEDAGYLAYLRRVFKAKEAS